MAFVEAARYPASLMTAAAPPGSPSMYVSAVARGNGAVAASLDGPPGPLTVGGRGVPLIAALADTAAFLDEQPDHVLLRITKHLGRQLGR
ncbi:hypothetical protein ABZ436_08950 [Micromonospora matsumotoense]|uniref:hypothetical protein n=1 Tax=Micromonospora matsumotoense TaxID=121616 RepID=UPI0033D7CBCE